VRRDFREVYLKSLLPIFALIFISTLGLAVLASQGKGASDELRVLLSYTFALFLVRWVAVDRRSQNFSAPFEFDAFVFFAWYVVLPYYLFKTRGPRGVAYCFGFWVLAILPTSISQIILAVKNK
jgi:hypothetical protein